jgi:hypothetical protein
MTASYFTTRQLPGTSYTTRADAAQQGMTNAMTTTAEK